MLVFVILGKGFQCFMPLFHRIGFDQFYCLFKRPLRGKVRNL
jgi:hypothetical protein